MKPIKISSKKTLFIFRRDLRYEDNTGLRLALDQSEKVITCFVIDPEQVGKNNNYKSNAALQFMTEALEDLSKILSKQNGQLYFFYGSPTEVVEKLIKTENIEAVYVNRDYTPFSIKRDDLIENVCKKLNVKFNSCDDLLLQKPETITKKDGGAYSVFTPFYKAMMKQPVQKPVKTNLNNFYVKPIKESFLNPGEKIKFVKNTKIHASRAECLKILKQLNQFKNYDSERDIPSLDATTHLSAYIKFGVCSIREIYEAIAQQLGKNHTLVKQLCWHDFFTDIAFHNPRIFGSPFNKKYSRLPWNNNSKILERWCEGKTGFPFVDAGMRELVSTGFMHNRMRMVTASFLVKDLHIDWQKGERFFANHLVDYDPAVNNGNWQWCASTGCDAQPYFRIFNPWLQQKKYDKDCIYIKRWIPELKNIPAKDIHAWYKAHEKYKNVYIKPMVEHDHESKLTKQIFRTFNTAPGKP